MTDQRVFNYRATPAGYTVGFLLVWSSIWLFATANQFSNPNFKINGRVASPSEARDFLIFSSMVGVVGLSIGLRLLFGFLNERIAIDGESIRCFDWLGRERLADDLRSIRAKEETGGIVDAPRMVIQSRGTSFKFSARLNDYGILRDLVTGKARTRFDHPTYAPAPQTFHYRGSSWHVSSFLFLAFGSMLMVFSEGEAWPALLIPMPIFVWAQLVGWVERIQLGPDGVVWTDLLGRTRVRAALYEIRTMDVISGHGGGARIYTDQGTVRCMTSIKNFSTLENEVEKVLASRKPLP